MSDASKTSLKGSSWLDTGHWLAERILPAVWVHRADSHCCTAETNKTLYGNYEKKVSLSRV